MSAEHIVIFCTVPDQETADKIADALVVPGLAACVNIVPGLKSVYTWKGAVCRDSELLCVIKSRASLFGKIEAAVRAIHPYEVPEIIALPIVAGHAPYVNWIDEVTENPCPNSK
ncbi:MAG TPA: divalent-cation tolerance protein CutA [Spirochaetota bacterium]|nr:divalent-cation tolerance protein CutA [Spirochaetota bacterium]